MTAKEVWEKMSWRCDCSDGTICRYLGDGSEPDCTFDACPLLRGEDE